MRQRLTFAVLIGFLFFLAALFYCVPSSPDMESVLSGKKSGGRDSLVLFSLFVFAAATFTAVKGYRRVGKKGRDCQREQLYIKIDELISEKKKTEGLNHLLDGENKNLKQDREQLFLRANELEGREKLLRQSILVLKKDIDNLLGQREKLEEELKKAKTGMAAGKKKKRRKNAKN